MNTIQLLADFTYAELREYLTVNDGLILPVGTTEQHGCHLPLNNDILVAEYLASRLAKETGMAVAPSIHYGVNLPLDAGLTGTAGIAADTLRHMVSAVTDCWRNQGFKRFYLVNYHGDPFHLRALTSIADDVFLLEPYEIDYSDILEAQTTIRHACEAETSVALYLYPERVRTGKIFEHDIAYAQFAPYLFHKSNTPPAGYTGALGVPSKATADKGRAIVQRMYEALIAQYAAAKKS